MLIDTSAKAGPAEARGLLRECLAEMTLDPEEPAVDIYYTLSPAAMEMGYEPSGAVAHRDGSGSGGRIRTCDLRVMSPTSYLAALPRDVGTL
jgi:hypothetical protein